MGTPNGVVCLGYKNINGIPFRDELKLLAGLAFPERPKTWAKLRAASIGIAYASAGNSRRLYNCMEDLFDTAGKLSSSTQVDWSDEDVFKYKNLFGVDFLDTNPRFPQRWELS